MKEPAGNVMLRIFDRVVPKCERHHAITTRNALNTSIAPRPGKPVTIDVCHGDARQTEARRSWPLETLKTTFADELFAWLRDIHAHESR
jgi:hypothetical protein